MPHVNGNRIKHLQKLISWADTSPLTERVIMKSNRFGGVFIAPLILSMMSLDAAAQNVVVTDQSAISQSVASTVEQNASGSSQSLVVNVARGGVYVISIPEESGFSVSIDDVILIEADAASLTAITSLSRGPHTVVVNGANVSAASFDVVKIHQANTFREVTLSSIAAYGGAQEEAMPTPSVVTTAAQVRPNGVGSGEGLRVSTNLGNILALGQDPAPEPVNVGDGAVSSPLAPPVNSTILQEVAIVTGATDEGLVATTGQTLFGRVRDYLTYDQVNVVISPSGRETTVSVGPNFGGFAVRLFTEDLTTGVARVTIRAASSQDETLTTEPVSYDYTAANLTDGLSMILSRATFGPTPDLYARVREIGYKAYLEEQFNPDSLDDSLFESLNSERFFNGANDERNVAQAIVHDGLTRAVYSEKQLQEITGMFWSNHFHAITKMSYVVKPAVAYREYFRENAFGNFEDMLLYSARSPLMSQFLDNDQSVVGNVNENYAREILELHTVGTDADYGDEDIIAVARIFTGWNFVPINPDAGFGQVDYDFEFRIMDHDVEDKYIPFLDVTIQGRSGPAGVEEGEELIAILSDLPATHTFVCRKIVQWLVADEPPANFVDMCTNAWLQSDGNSEAMLRAILLSPEFVNTPEIWRSKGKTPFEYTASFLRSSGVQFYDAAPEADGSNGEDWGAWARYVTALRNVGYIPGIFELPTGLDEAGTSWSNSSVMNAVYNAPELTIRNRRTLGIFIEERMEENRLETAEELAAYLLAIATTDHYRRDEFEAMLSALEVNREPFRADSIWAPRAISRAVAMSHIIPSFGLQ